MSRLTTARAIAYWLLCAMHCALRSLRPSASPPRLELDEHQTPFGPHDGRWVERGRRRGGGGVRGEPRGAPAGAREAGQRAREPPRHSAGSGQPGPKGKPRVLALPARELPSTYRTLYVGTYVFEYAHFTIRNPSFPNP